MSTQPPTINPRSFWQRPEGKVGIALLLIGGGIALYALLPALITLFTNLVLATSMAIAALISLAALFMIWKIVTNKKLWFLYKVLMRKMVGAIIELNPIAVMRTYIDEVLKKKRAELRANLDKLAGELVKIRQQIKSNDAECEKQLAIAQEAEKGIDGLQPDLKNFEAKYGAGDDSVYDQLTALRNQSDLYTQQYNISTAQSGRLAQANEELRPLAQDIQRVSEILRRIDRITETKIQDLTNEVNTMESKLKAIEAGNSALKAAMGVLSGSGDEYETFMTAQQATLERCHTQAGEIMTMLQDASEAVVLSTLQQGANRAKGEQMLKKLESNLKISTPITDRIEANSSAGESFAGAGLSALNMPATTNANNVGGKFGLPD